VSLCGLFKIESIGKNIVIFPQISDKFIA